jgi:cation diffusion facilitator family transporter
LSTGSDDPIRHDLPGGTPPAAAGHAHDHENHEHPHVARHDDGHDDGHDDHGHAHAEAAHDHPHPHPAEAQGDHGHEHGGHGHDHGDHDHDHEHEHEHRGGLIGFLRGLVAPHSHDSFDSLDTALESSSKGIRAVKISLVALMVTALFQVVLVIVTGSVALLADTIHNFSDALTSVPLWIAFILGRRAANRRYTYGYRRAEDIAGLFIVGMITFSAFLAGWESIQRLLNPQPISNIGLVFAAGLIGFVGNEVVALYRIRVGKEIGSAALVADGYHARTDGFTSLAVVVGAIGVALGFPQADPLVGLLITVAILWVLKDAARQVFGRLMDAVDPELVDQIERRASAIKGVKEVDGVRVRWIGHRLEASLHATVHCEITVLDGHAIAEEVRHDLLHSVRGLDEVLVHVDPCAHEELGIDPHATSAHHATAPLASVQAPGAAP